MKIKEGKGVFLYVPVIVNGKPKLKELSRIVPLLYYSEDNKSTDIYSIISPRP